MMKNLDELCEFKNGLWKGKKGSFAPIKILRNTNFNDDGRFDFMNAPMYEVEVKQLESRVLEYGDILLERSGGGPKQPVGRVAFFDIRDNKARYSFSNFTTRMRVNDKEELNEIFLWRFLYYLYTNGETVKMQRQTHGIRNLDFSEYKQIKVPLPNLSEQNRIVEILEKADSLRKQRQEANEASNDMIRSIFLEMFGGASKCKKMSIKEVCTLINGKAFKPSDWTDNGLKIVRIQNLNDKTKPFNYYNGPVRGRFLINSGDILISWSGTPGTSFGCFIWDRGEAVLNQHIFKTVIKKDVVNEVYFVAAINNILNEMINKAHGGVGLRHITKRDLEAIKIIVPPLSQQQKFADLVQKIDKIKEKQQESKQELDNLFSSLMQRAFS